MAKTLEQRFKLVCAYMAAPLDLCRGGDAVLAGRGGGGAGDPISRRWRCGWPIAVVAVVVADLEPHQLGTGATGPGPPPWRRCRPWRVGFPCSGNVRPHEPHGITTPGVMRPAPCGARRFQADQDDRWRNQRGAGAAPISTSTSAMTCAKRPTRQVGA